MKPQIQEKPNHQLNVNSKSAYIDMDGRVRMQDQFNEEEKQAVAKHQLKNNYSKFKYMRPRSENIVAAELIRYFQQKDALLSNKIDEINPKSKADTLEFYDYKINELKKQLHEINPERLAKIEQQRINDTTVVGAEIIDSRSNKAS